MAQKFLLLKKVGWF